MQPSAELSHTARERPAAPLPLLPSPSGHLLPVPAAASRGALGLTQGFALWGKHRNPPGLSSLWLSAPWVPRGHFGVPMARLCSPLGALFEARVLQLRKTPPSNPLPRLGSQRLLCVSPLLPLLLCRAFLWGLLTMATGPLFRRGRERGEEPGGWRKEGQERKGGRKVGGGKEGDIWISATEECDLWSSCAGMAGGSVDAEQWKSPKKEPSWQGSSSPMQRAQHPARVMVLLTEDRTSTPGPQDWLRGLVCGAQGWQGRLWSHAALPLLPAREPSPGGVQGGWTRTAGARLGEPNPAESHCQGTGGRSPLPRAGLSLDILGVQEPHGPSRCSPGTGCDSHVLPSLAHVQLGWSRPCPRLLSQPGSTTGMEQGAGFGDRR